MALDPARSGASPDLRALADDVQWLAGTDPAEARLRLDALRATVPAGPAWEGELALLEARISFTEGRYDEAKAGIATAVTWAVEQGDKPLAAAAQTLAGTIHLERGDYAQAADEFGAARERYQELGDRAALARLQNNLGLVHWRLDDVDGAREAFTESLQVFRELDDRRAIGNVLNNLGLVASARGDYEASLDLYRQAVETLEPVGDRVFLANSLANIADELEVLGRTEEALGPARRALALREEIGHSRGIAGSSIALARLALVRGDLEGAATHMGRAETLTRQLGLRKHAVDLLDLRSRRHAALGEYQEAWELSQRHGAERQALVRDDLRHRVAELHTRYALAQARAEAETRRRENEALREARDAADAASRAKSEFVATMSHEIRTPVATLLGALEVLQDSLDATQRELVAAMRSSGAALLAVVDDVLDFAAIEAGRVQFHAAAFRLEDVTREAAAFARHRACAKGLSFRATEAPDGDPPRWGDAERVRQVLVNLLANAVKFTEVGWVEFRVRLDPPPWVVFEVRDTGPGIESSTLARLFQPFVQGDSSTRRRHGGTGLGLVIARRLAEGMGGRLDVDTAVGQGSTFRVVLPLPSPAVPAGEAPRRPDPAGPLAVRVLLVEDDATLSMVLQRLLERLGCRVDAVFDGLSALRRVEEAPPEVVLLDVHLPGMDGFEIAEALRLRPGARIPVVGLTGAATEQDRRRGLEAGMDDYLTKPVSSERLVQALRAVTRTAEDRTGAGRVEV